MKTLKVPLYRRLEASSAMLGESRPRIYAVDFDVRSHFVHFVPVNTPSFGENMAYLGRGFDECGIMNTGARENNARVREYIENGNNDNRSREQLLGRGSRPDRSEIKLSPRRREASTRRSRCDGVPGNARGLGAHHDRRHRRDHKVSQNRSKEIATPPEVATYQQYSIPRPLPAGYRCTQPQ